MAASLGQARGYLGVAVINDHLYAIGGYNGSLWLNCVERYDPLRDQWTSGKKFLINLTFYNFNVIVNVLRDSSLLLIWKHYLLRNNLIYLKQKYFLY